MRKWLSIISAFVFFLVILAIAGVWQFKRVLNDLHIEAFSYHLEALNLHKVKFSELSFVHKTKTAQHTIQLRNLTVDWLWQSWLAPQLSAINIEQAHLVQAELSDLNLLPSVGSPSQPFFSLPESWLVPEAFPEQIHIQMLIVKLPCAAGLCSFAGIFDALKIKTGHVTTGVNFKLTANPGETVNNEHQLVVDARYSAEQNLPMLDTKFGVDDRVNLQLSTRLQDKNERYWIGSLKGYATYPDDWWLTYLKAWNIQIAPQTDEQKITAAKISLDTEWQLALAPLINLPKTASVSDGIKVLTGHWMLTAKIPMPLMIANFGEFSGNANIDLDIRAGQLNRYALVADVTANHLVVPNELQMRGLVADAVHLQIQSNMDSAVSLNALPVVFSGETQGALHSNLAGRLWVDVLAKKITIENLALSAKAKQLKPIAGMQLDNISVDLHAAGHWQADNFEFSISAASQLSADVLAKNVSVIAKSTRFSTAQLNISGDIAKGAIVWPQLKFTTEAMLTGGKFQHPQVNAKAWYWRGKVQGSLADFNVTGDLGVTGDRGMGTTLIMAHQLKRKASDIMLDWNTADVFLLAANPFADTLSAWPPLLSLSQGKINASGNIGFDIEKNKLTNSNTVFQLADISGVYDTAVFQGLSSQVKVVTADNTLAISTDKLSVNHINKGFDFGPFVAVGKYQSSWDKLLQGKLNVQSFSCATMGGSLTTAAQQFDFNHDTQKFMLELKDINVASLLKQYSASELSGTGQLSGTVPIEINRAGVRIAQGMVAAAVPGGLIQMKSARANAMAKNQPGMKLIVDALNDFHYTALASQINYDEKGKLLLSIKLEGRNPALEHGRPVNLNINLEEDVPAMLASIQLGSKVTDIVKKRLQERVQKKEISDKETLNATP